MAFQVPPTSLNENLLIVDDMEAGDLATHEVYWLATSARETRPVPVGSKRMQSAGVSTSSVYRTRHVSIKGFCSSQGHLQQLGPGPRSGWPTIELESTSFCILAPPIFSPKLVCSLFLSIESKLVTSDIISKKNHGIVSIT